MIGDPVTDYVAATRLTADPSPVDPATALPYAQAFQSICTLLDLSSRPKPPSLRVVRTANATVENLRIGGSDVILYDKFLGLSFLQLTTFTLAESPPEVVIRWGLKRLAYALTVNGAAWPALSAHHLSTQLPVLQQPLALSEDTSRLASRSVMIQEHFVLAHECMHSALRLGSLDEAMVRSATDLVRQAIDAAQGTMGAETTHDVVEAVVDDEIAAINAGSKFYRVSPEERADLIRRRRSGYPLVEYVGNWVSARPYLIEELVCDFLATDLTLAHFATFDVEPLDVLDAILLGFHNHGSMETVRDFALFLARGSRSPHISSILQSRRVVWRTAAPDLWGEHAASVAPAEVRGRFVNIVERASTAVGDQLAYTLQADFTARLARVSTLPDVPRDVVTQLVLDEFSSDIV